MRKIAFWLLLLLPLLSGVPLGGAFAQSGVRAVVVNEFANIRIVPAIGADVIATVPAGFVFEIVTGRSSDNQWLRVDFNGQEGWVNLTPLTVLSGDVSTLPVADPRSIPYGGFEAPRAGLTSAISEVQAYLPTSGLRVRAGPSTGYPVLADMPRFSRVSVFGRTASNGWVQVNYEGTLGWVSSSFVELSVNIWELPIDGIIAEALQPSEAVATNYINTLKLMLARIDLAQPSLDRIRASWADSALTGRAACDPYPPRPSDYNIPNDLLAAYYNILFPLITEFNDAMFNVRRAIDLFIEVCNQPGTANPVGQATVIGALETVALADRQFANLRRRLTELIPPDLEVGENECLFTFRNESQVLPVIPIGEIIVDNFTPRKIVTGYCFDAAAGQTLLFQTLQRPPSNIAHFLTVSPFDNPTNFLAVGQAAPGTPLLSVGPLLVPETGRYLLVLSNIAPLTEPLNGTFGVLLAIPTLSGQQILSLNPQTGEFFIGFQGVGFQTETCPDITFTCAQLTTCGQAQACFAAGNFSLDGDGDGIPCEALCGSGGQPPFLPPGQPPPGGQPPFLPPPGQPPPFTGSDTGNTSPVNPSVVCPGLSLTCEQLTTCDQAYACLAAGSFQLDPDGNGIPCPNLCGG